MRRGEYKDFNEFDTLLEEEPKEKQKQWNLFKSEPRKADVGSTVETPGLDSAIKFLKFVTIAITFAVVLGCAVISKATVLLMSAQIKSNVTRPYCNKEIDTRQQFIVTLPEAERATWVWIIMLTYFAPEVATLFRSVRIVLFKSWEYPSKMEFSLLFVTESLPAIGSALLVFVVFPELDAIKAAMLTNAVCFVPALITFFSRSSCAGNNLLKMLLDVFSIVAQASAFIIWPLVENKAVLYVIPVAVVLISFGWWENFVTEKSPIKFVSSYAKLKKEFHNRNYFIYSIVAPVKCLLFFVTALVVFYMRDGSVSFLFDNFWDVFNSHTLDITEVEPMITSDGFNVEDAILTGLGTVRSTTYWTPMSILILHVFCTYTCYAFGKFACKIMIQTFSFAFAINLTVPILLTVLIALCGEYNEDPCSYSGFIPSYLFFNVPSLTFLGDFLTQQCSWAWLIWLLSQTWITVHIWNENEEKLARTENLFMRPMYDAFLIDQSLSMNRRRKQPAPKQLRRESEEHVEDVTDQNKDNITRIYACATMWHETKEEMISFLKSIFRMDEDQCAHRLVRTQLQYNLPNYYEFETHIHFDDAFFRLPDEPDDPDPPLNKYVMDMIDAVNVAASEVHATNVRIKPPIIYSTPYGGRLEWTLPGKTKMVAHLKDNAKIRNKKRWSQCMYMYYLLGYRIMDNEDLPEDMIKKLSENTYLLALDGDIDFQPQAVHLLVDYMKKNKSLGAACGRIHPVGSGAMAWYQVFEYAVGHWLQKATEHVIGCVLCSPGCFSLFRACALMDDNVMAKYTTMSSEARHYVQYDQGEDRWLCTLMLQRGYRVEYSAASDSYTHCPEGFNEFFNQRRRWMPSTTANILDLLSDYKYIVNINDNISKLYMLYQLILMIGTVIGPGSIFLMLVGAFVAAFKLDQWTSFFWNILPILAFVICCALCKSETQLFMAAIISAIYGLVMMAVLIGIFMQIKDDGLLAPSSLFFLIMASQFVITAMMHPQEFYCLKYGVIYYVTVPSMYMLLVIYSVFNMNNVSWGTRVSKEALEAEKAAQANEPKTEGDPKDPTGSFFNSENKDNAGSFELSFAGLFKLMCCTFEKGGREDEMLRSIQASLAEVNARLNQIEKNQWDPHQSEPRKSRAKTVHIDGSRASRMTLGGVPPLPRKTEPKLFEDADMMVDEEEDEYMEDESIDVPENSWFYNGDLKKGDVQFLDTREKKFWEELIKVYLYPIIENKKQKEDISQELKDLRDNMVVTFFLINCLYVLVIFLLTLQKETLHLDWPINPTINFTYYTDQNQILIQHTYLELEPIGFVFLISFALLMVIQFTAMLIHRFGTYCQIMSNTVLDFSLFESKDVNNMTGEKILRRDPIRIIKKLIKLQGINDDDDEDRDAPVARRNTAHFLALKKKKASKPIIEELDKAFFARMEKIQTGEIKESDLPVPRKTIAALNNRRETIQRRKSQMPNFNNLPRPSVLPPNFNNQKEDIFFENAGYDQDDVDV